MGGVGCVSGRRARPMGPMPLTPLHSTHPLTAVHFPLTTLLSARWGVVVGRRLRPR